METSAIIFLLLGILGWGLGAFFDKLSLKAPGPVRRFLCALAVHDLHLHPAHPLEVRAHQAGAPRLGQARADLRAVQRHRLHERGLLLPEGPVGGRSHQDRPAQLHLPGSDFRAGPPLPGRELPTLNKFIGTMLVSGGIYFISNDPRGLRKETAAAIRALPFFQGAPGERRGAGPRPAVRGAGEAVLAGAFRFI